MLLAMIY